MKTILAAIDFSSVTAKVCEEACRLAVSEPGSELVLLNAVPPPVMVDYYNLTLLTESLSVAERAAATQLRRWQKRCAARGVNTTVEQITGPATAIIADQLKRWRPDYLVVGSHGHGAVYELLVGSTTLALLRQAKCPVVVVPPQGRPAPRRPAAAKNRIEPPALPGN